MTAGSCDVAIMRPSRGRLSRASFDVPAKAEEHAGMALLAGAAAAFRGPASAVLPVILLFVLGAPGRARAETSSDDKALATVLFKEGRSSAGRRTNLAGREVRG